MSAYSGFACVYGKLQRGVDYGQMCTFTEDALERHGIKGRSVLDLACGDGALLECMLGRGWDVTGADASAQMLCEADARLFAKGLSCLLLCQPMQELDLYGTVNAAVCTLDSVNHLGSIGDFTKTLGRLHLFIEPGGLFIFDVNTLYKHREVLSNNCFVYDTEEAFCVWQNELDNGSSDVNITLDIFVPRQSGVYSRISEEFTERYFSPEELESALNKAGFTVLELYGGYGCEPVTEQAQRAVYIARRD